jgi:polar amino acid transport system permease protein
MSFMVGRSKVVSDFFELARQILPNLLAGLWITMELWLLCLVLGGILAIATALCRIYGNKPIYYLATAYIEIVRGTPLLVQIFIIYYGLGDIGILLSPFLSAVIAFSVNTAAYQAEYIRGAIQSIRGGQIEAALAIGMSKYELVRYIVLPQAFRLVIPPWSNEAILMLKFTSVAFLITVPELMARGRMIATSNYRYIEVFTIVACIYLIVVLIFTFLLDRLESRINIPGLGMSR